MEHDNTPADNVRNIEGSQSTSPLEGAGLHLSANKLEGQCLFIGKVDDTYPASGCCKVSLYSRHTDVPCVVLGNAMGYLFGARSVSIPSIGTEVLVYVPLDRKYGYIIGCSPGVSTNSLERPAGQLVVEGGTGGYNENDPFCHYDWSRGKDMPAAGGGATVDALPGDSGVINDLGCFVGLLRSIALLKGSELAKVEAFALDDLLTVVGHNMNVFTAQGETRVFDDHGRISGEQQFAYTTAEALGASEPGEDAFVDNPESSVRTAPDQASVRFLTEKQVLKPRWKKWTGWLGDFIQSFVSRPAAGTGSLKTADLPDMGMYQSAITLSGQHMERSVVGGGIHKSLQIAVPKKKLEHDDPEGDKELANQTPISDFKFSEKHPMGIGAQSRDYFAWLFNSVFPRHKTLLTKDWEMPDEASCPYPGTTPQVPGLGTFFREFRPEEEAMGTKEGMSDDTVLASKKFRVGEGYIGFLPDGSILLRNAWGDSWELRAGHSIVSVSKDATTIAGGSVVNLAGDDVIVKAKKSIDITSTDQQVRVKGGRDVLIHAEKGGIGITAESSEPFIDTAGVGEKLGLVGVLIKSNLGVTAHSDYITLAAKSLIQFKGTSEEDHPNIMTDCYSSLNYVRGGTVMYRLTDDYVVMTRGNILSTGSYQSDGSIFVRGGVAHGGGAGQIDITDQPTVASGLEGNIDNDTFASVPYTTEQLAEFKFTYRSTLEYATNDGQWYAAQWQLDTPGLDIWEETPIADTYPYPGEKHYSSDSQSFLTYNEKNVFSTGKPKSRAEQTAESGVFSAGSFSDFKVHPSR